MDKSILREYVDACALVEETEKAIEKRRRNRTVYDKVKGSNPEFPYQAQSFNISGCVEECLSNADVDKEKLLLIERKANAERIKTEVEAWMNTIPVRMQRIVQYKFFEGMSWKETAIRLGKRYTEESIKKEYQRFMKEK